MIKVKSGTDPGRRGNLAAKRGEMQITGQH